MNNQTIVWGTADRVFKAQLGRRLQHAFGEADFVEVPHARTLVSIDAAETLADVIAVSFARGTASRARNPRTVTTSSG